MFLFNVEHNVGDEVRAFMCFSRACVCCRYPAVCMHGDKSQQERDYVLRGMHFYLNSSNVEPTTLKCLFLSGAVDFEHQTLN